VLFIAAAVNVMFVVLPVATKLAPTSQFVPPSPLSSTSVRWTDAKFSTSPEPEVPRVTLDAVNLWFVASHVPPTA